MDHLPENHAAILLLMENISKAHRLRTQVLILMLCIRSQQSRKQKLGSRPYLMIPRIPSQVAHLNRLVKVSDRECVNNLRMDRNTFAKLCELLKVRGGLTDGRYISVEEQVAIFLSVLAHHKKNSIVSFNFQRSGQTISHYVHLVLGVVIKLYSTFLAKPTAVDDSCTDPRWIPFKGCLGALDGTYINVHVKDRDKGRYRNRKGDVSTNTLAACDRELRFVYVLPGWEGSAADGRVLRDALNREYGLKVPRGSYYLCDNGYANSEGFLTPYKGVRYHLKEWGPAATIPQTREELYNMRHTKARNVIERAFGVLKMRWGILRTASFYPIKVQTRLIMACFLLHNFIRSEMHVDPIEAMMDNLNGEELGDIGDNEAFIDYVESTPAWNNKRDELAQHMWDSR